MALALTPEEGPQGPLHPAYSRYVGFTEGNVRWSSVALYGLAQKLAVAEDREKIRGVHALEEAEALAQAMPRLPDAEERAVEVMRHALALSFDQNLKCRTALLATADERLEVHLGADARLGVGLDGRGENLLGEELMAMRAVLVARAADPGAVQCGHEDPALELNLVCVHLLAHPGHHRRHFTGAGAAYELLCDACVDALPAEPPRRKLCEECFAELRQSDRRADLGAPAFLQRASTLQFSHRTFKGPPEVIAFAPVARQPHTWLMLDRAGVLHRVDVERGSSEPGTRVDASVVELTQPILLVASPDGELAAVAEKRGRRAVVLEPASGKVTQTLLRDDYHPKHCTFPLGFFALDGRLLLVHATVWNRLDVSDPRTGEPLTPRELDEAHGLDYFHSGLVVSPDGQRVLDNGWVWHPIGMMRAFSLEAWLRENVWESEDGPSAKRFGYRPYYWDGPVAWLDSKTIATWGGDEDEVDLLPIAVLYDVETGKQVRRIVGPAEGFLSLPPYLLAFDAAQGTSVWDWQTGERLLHDPSFTPSAVHPGSQELLAIVEGGFRVSTLK